MRHPGFPESYLRRTPHKPARALASDSATPPWQDIHLALADQLSSRSKPSHADKLGSLWLR